MRDKQTLPLLVRNAVADTWAQFVGRVMMIAGLFGLMVLAFFTAH